MRVLRNAALSRKALWHHRARTALALGGTTVGVAVVLAMIAVGEGAGREVVERIAAMGRNVLVVSAVPVARTARRRAGPGGTVRTLTLDDARAILQQSRLIARAAPSQDRPFTVTVDGRSTGTTVRATTADYGAIRDFPTAEGRYFTPEEDRAGRRVVILGARVREGLFGTADAVGRTIRIGRIPFEVIGVLAAKGTSVTGAVDEDAQIVIPINTGLRRVFNLDYLELIYLEAVDAESMDDAEAEVAAILRERHRLDRLGKPDDFRIQNLRLVLDAEMAAVRSFRFMIVGMGGAALVVGGVGILSIMVLSVRERRSEIGLRVAVGARRNDIRLQFLLEALTLGAAGGAGGLLLGTSAAWLVGRFTEWNAVVTVPSVLIAVATSLGVGVLAGWYPASRAASWDPIEALRAE